MKYRRVISVAGKRGELDVTIPLARQNDMNCLMPVAYNCLVEVAQECRISSETRSLRIGSLIVG